MMQVFNYKFTKFEIWRWLDQEDDTIESKGYSKQFTKLEKNYMYTEQYIYSKTRS
jgi:hypothetical protein